MNQVVQPDLSVVGYPDYCLAYVQTVFKVPVSNPHDPDAWHGWLDAQFKHTDTIPTDVSVPIWFSWSGTVEGVYDNYGHVAVSTPNGVYTNPLSGSGHKVFPSVQALATNYGVKYVGWSEDIESLRVVEGDDMTKKLTSTDQVRQIYLSFGLDIAGNDPILQKFVDDGATDYDLILGIAPQVKADLLAAQSAAGGVTKDSVINYINGHLS